MCLLLESMLSQSDFRMLLKLSRSLCHPEAVLSPQPRIFGHIFRLKI